MAAQISVALVNAQTIHRMMFPFFILPHSLSSVIVIIDGGCASSAARVEWRADAHFGAEASAAAGLFDSDGGRAEITERIRKVFSSFATALDAELIKKR